MNNSIRFVLFCLSLSTSFFSFAQEKVPYQQDAGTVSYGPKAGFTTGYIKSESLGSSKFRVAYVLGAFGRYQISKNFAVQLDLLYNERGGRFESDNNNTLVVETLDLAFLDPQFTAIFNTVTKLGKLNFKWDIYAGFQPAILLKAEFDGEDASDNLKSISLDALLGGSIYVGRVVLSSTLKLGLNNLNDTYIPTNDAPKIKSISTDWTIAYRFGGLKK